MLSRWIAAGLLLILGFGVPAQAKPLAADVAFPHQGGVLEELSAYVAALFLMLKSDGGLCGTGYCPTPPPPPPPGHVISIVAGKPRPAGKGSLP